MPFNKKYENEKKNPELLSHRKNVAVVLATADWMLGHEVLDFEKYDALVKISVETKVSIIDLFEELVEQAKTPFD